MTTTASYEEVIKLCRAAWEAHPIQPDVCITFCTGGLFAAGILQKVGMQKVSVFGLPWIREESYPEAFVVNGPELKYSFHSQILPFCRVIAIVDDIFDTGATITRCLRELASQTNPNVRYALYAPYRKAGFLLGAGNGNVEVSAGTTIPKDEWIEFFWEK